MSGPLLLLHGFSGAPRAWEPIRSRLPGDTRALCPELAGHGMTPTRAWDEEVERLAGLLEREGARDVHLVGYSMGGRLAWSLLERGLPAIARATLIGAHPGLESARAREERRAADASWVELLRREGLAAFVEAWEALPLWDSQRALPEPARAWRRAIRSGHDAEGLAGAIETLGLAEMPPVDPSRVGVPVTLIAGERDARHRGLATGMVGRLREGRVRVVGGAGHDVGLERPDALAALLASRGEEAA